MPILFHNITLATMQNKALGLIVQGALVCQDGKIIWLGTEKDLPAQWQPLKYSGHQSVNGQGKLLTPSLIDCHTHLAWGGSRAHEFKMRLHGASYEEIAAQGGGIISTVQATRAASEDALFKMTKKRAETLIEQGVSCVEIKSGYGLTLEDELKQLRVARRIAQALPIRVRTTLLAAHALPPEYSEADAYIDFICHEIIPQAAAEGLADAVDAFCENIGFTREQTERVFKAAQTHGLPVKLHAEQLSDQDGARLVAEYQGLSADHLEHLSDAGIAAMAQADTVAVLLPGAYYFLRETHLPPIEKMRQAGVKMALSTDANPGTSPLIHLPLMMHLGCTLFRLTPEEAWLGTTKHAAQALGLSDCGELAVGKRADLALWNLDAPEEICYEFGANPLIQRYFAGDSLNL